MPVSNMSSNAVSEAKPLGLAIASPRSTGSRGLGPAGADGEQHGAERAERVPGVLRGTDELPSGLGHACLLGGVDGHSSEPAQPRRDTCRLGSRPPPPMPGAP